MKLRDMFFASADQNEAPAKAETAPKWIGTKAAVQREPATLTDRTGRTFHLFIDTVVRLDQKTVILGWATCPKMEVVLIQGARKSPQTFTRHARGDVADVMKLASGDNLGFAIVSTTPLGKEGIELEFSIPRCDSFQTGSLAERDKLSAVEQSLLPELMEGQLAELRNHEMGGKTWWSLLEEVPEITQVPAGYHGFVEGIFVSPEGNGVVFGWALHPDDAMIWLEDDAQHVYPLQQAFRRERRDIAEAFREVLWSDMEAAFIAHIPELETNPRIRLRVVTEVGVATLSERAGAERLPPEPRHAAEKLFAIETEDRLFYRRAPVVDWPVLKPLIDTRRAEISRLSAQIKDFGTLPQTPEVSVIVPLYKRFDFIEHQLLEFVRDSGFLARAELIYVIDDPDIHYEVMNEADKLHRLHDIPFRVVSGMRNRGFSGANNLGAKHARGEYLLFLNSDVIPIEPGWLEQMLAGFADETVGAVGARLLFPDGGIQHAGMDFEYLEQFHIWSNQHPGMGLDPELDQTVVREVPAVTGACLMITRRVFDEVGGWDTGYLLGDFEDSDLCFTVRKAGYRILYQPSATLTHLERQSFTSLGGDAFRIRMTICNALRHQSRWGDMLDGSAEPEIAAEVPELQAQEAQA